MNKLYPTWTLTHKKQFSDQASEPIPATVPGAVQLDYAKAYGYKDYWYEENYKQFTWMEDEYWTYSTELDFTCAEGEKAIFYFGGIDYEYTILANGTELCHGEGMFTPVKVDLTAFSGQKTRLDAVIHPIPKCNARPYTRYEARESCKPPSAYGWDWHPRLVPMGIWEESYLEIIPEGTLTNLECTYRLNDTLDICHVDVTAEIYGEDDVTVTLNAPDGTAVYSETRRFTEGNTNTVSFELQKPKLWYPRGYGDQPIYVLTAECGKSPKKLTKKLGFRRAKLVRNPDDEAPGFPKSRYDSPATFEINGIKVFAKGSNWVNTEIFPCLMDEKRYRELIDLAYGANMNVFRVWGGGFINKESFYDICDEYGIMIWQEFMMSCNLYPDKDHFLSVLEREVTTIVKRLRTHPCLVLWCGGNELLNSWSGMTEQSHALRLIDAICYKYDRFTPYNMTSPLTGMGHGSYHNLVNGEEGRSANPNNLPEGVKLEGEYEFLTALTYCRHTAYTEFGCCGGATPEYIKKYVTDGESYENCSPDNPVWVAHHAFNSWSPSSWLRKCEVEYYFGGYSNVDDLLNKTLVIQSVCYKTMFEEMRKQAPRCSMAINWDYNEPWPCAAGNSLVNWPAEPKPALDSVREALRPTLASLRAFKNRYVTGETLKAEIWLLNDSPNTVAPTDIRVYLEADGKRNRVYTVPTDTVNPRENAKFGEFSFEVTEEIPAVFKLILEVPDRPEYNSEYTMFHR